MAGMRMSREMSRSRSRARRAVRSMSMSALLGVVVGLVDVVVQVGVVVLVTVVGGARRGAGAGELDLHGGPRQGGVRVLLGARRRLLRGRHLDGDALVVGAHQPPGDPGSLERGEGDEAGDVAAVVARLG